VVPLLSEADNILPLYERLVSAMEAEGWTWEVIFVDDGGTDATFQLLQGLHAKDERVLRLRRNFGQTAVLAAGFDAARGSIIVSGVQFLCMGILAEIQIRTYYESARRPIYTIRVESGTHDELLAQAGTYARLYDMHRRQMSLNDGQTHPAHDR
jgi:glycosyltransferase involved in cell wall biosynthesis